MPDVKFPKLITPEIIKTISQHADDLKKILDFENDNAVIGQSVTLSGDDSRPKVFIGCDVTIINKNAACENERPPEPCRDVCPGSSNFAKHKTRLIYNNGLTSTMIIRN